MKLCKNEGANMFFFSNELKKISTKAHRTINSKRMRHGKHHLHLAEHRSFRTFPGV